MRTLNKNLRRSRRPALKPPPARPQQAPRRAPARAIVPARPSFPVPSVLTWYVHVHGPTVRANKETRQNHALVLVRRSDRLGEMVLARHAELTGPSRLVHAPTTPLPETEGNAVAVISTTSPVAVYLDPPGPTHLAVEIPLARCERVLLDDAAWERLKRRAQHRFQRP